MKAQCFFKRNKGQVSMETAWLVALVGLVLIVALGPMKKSLAGFFLGKGNEMSSMKFDKSTTGNIKTSSDSKYKETSDAGLVKQVYSQNDSGDNTSVHTDR